jgi:hypothetical protein
LLGARIGAETALSQGLTDVLVGHFLEQIISQSLALLSETGGDELDESVFISNI